LIDYQLGRPCDLDLWLRRWNAIGF